MEYGITESGFIAKPYSVILAEEREAWKAAFGYDIDTSADTPEGAYIGNQVMKLVQLWEKYEGLWAIGDSDTASGIYLDRLAAMVNVQRKSAVPTTVYVALWGDEGTPVLAGHLTKLTTREQFALQESITINRAKLLGFLFKISEVDTETYSFNLSGTLISYTATEDDTEETIQAGLFDQIEAVLPGEYVGVNSGADGMEIHSAVGIVPFSLSCDDPKIEISQLGALGIYKAVVPGSTFAAIGALDRIVSNVSGLDHVINYATGITGRAKESDTELRIEKNNRQRQASGNENAIENEIKKVAGVRYCRVYSNRTMTVKNDRPPKSFEAVIMGGIDQDIAEAIFAKAPAGIQAYGNTIIEVIDAEGFPWSIGFSRPENQYIWIKISYSKNPEESFPINGVELMKDNIDTWGADNQDVGIDFIFQKLTRPIYDVPGIGFADIKVAVTDDTTPPADNAYTATNITINERQIALVDKTRITVSELVEGGA
jgi:uncharacterized phage protein gp47/JayE